MASISEHTFNKENNDIIAPMNVNEPIFTINLNNEN